MGQASESRPLPSAWHVSPWVDVAAYHLSWAPALFLLLYFLRHPIITPLVLILIGFVGFAHRNLTLVYAYGDGVMRRRHARRLAITAALLAAGLLLAFGIHHRTWPGTELSTFDAVLPAIALLCLPALRAWWRRPGSGDEPAWHFFALIAAAWGLLHLTGGEWTSGHVHLVPASPETGLALVVMSAYCAIRARAGILIWAFVLTAFGLWGLAWLTDAGLRELWANETIHGTWLVGAAAFAGAPINTYHVIMQKYGILRIYDRKARLRGGRGVEGRVDKFLLFSWLVPAIAMQAPYARGAVMREMKDFAALYDPIMAPVISVREPLLVLGFLLWGASIVIFLVAEWRANRLRSVPRLSMAVSTTLLVATFLHYNALVAYLVFAFSHGVEYIVFMWAYHRKQAVARGAPARRPRLALPLVSSLRPMALVAGGLAGLTVAYILWALPANLAINRLIASTAEAPVVRPLWLVLFGAFANHAHFYIDSFLWKMRDPDVFKNV